MRFRDDIDINNTWVTSDSHFGHDNIVGFCHRPEDHEQVMIAEWRAHVPDDATVLHLGDLCYKSNGFFKHIVAKELTGGRKLLIKGNHDRNTRKFYNAAGFQMARPFKIALNQFRDLAPATRADEAEGLFLDDGWLTVSFSHYPWNEAEEGLMPNGHTRLHGHIHNSGYSRDAFVPFIPNHINLSVEQTKYRPVNLGLLLRGALLGKFPATTDEQLAEAAARKEANRA